LGSLLKDFHLQSHNDTLPFHSIAANKYKCEELFVAHRQVQKTLRKLQVDPEFQLYTTTELEKCAMSNNSLLIERLCRRAMLRNHCYYQWFTAVVYDEFIVFYVKPVSRCFNNRFGKYFK
jgi:hypothetical protein